MSCEGLTETSVSFSWEHIFPAVEERSVRAGASASGLVNQEVALDWSLKHCDSELLHLKKTVKNSMNCSQWIGLYSVK